MRVLADHKVIMETYGALLIILSFHQPRYRITPRATGRKFKHAKRYTNAITRETCDTSFAQYPRFSSLRFSRNGSKVQEINFIYQSFFVRLCFFSLRKINKFTLRLIKKNCRTAFSSFLVTKEGCTLPCRRVDLGTHGHGATLL